MKFKEVVSALAGMCLCFGGCYGVIKLANTEGCKNMSHSGDDERDNPSPRIEVQKSSEKEFWGDSIYVVSKRIDTVYFNKKHIKN